MNVNNGRNKVLKLKKTLYGLRQIPRAFWKYMTSMIEICGIVQSKIDQCLFIGKKVMAIIYVDELFFGQWMSMTFMTKR